MQKRYKSLEVVISEQLHDEKFKEEYNKELIINALAEEVYRLRTTHNLTQKELAERVGTTQPVIARLETGRDTRVPSLEMLIKIATACDTSFQIQLGQGGFFVNHQ